MSCRKVRAERRGYTGGWGDTAEARRRSRASLANMAYNYPYWSAGYAATVSGGVWLVPDRSLTRTSLTSGHRTGILSHTRCWPHRHEPIAILRRTTMADLALGPYDDQLHYLIRSVRCYSSLRSLRAVTTVMVLAAAITLVPGAAAPAAPFKTGDEVADSVLPQEEDTTNRPEIEEALKQLQANDLDAALETLKAAREKYPEMAPARVTVASLILRSRAAGAAQSAHRLLDLAVAEDPSDPEAYMILGSLAIRNQLLTEATLLFDKGDELAESFQGDASRLERFSLQSRSGRAQLAELQRDWETAEKLLREMIALNDENAQTHQRLGRALFMLGSGAQREEAYKEYTRASELAANAPKAEVALAVLYANDDKEGSDAKALEWMNYAVQQHPDHVATRIQMAQHLVNIGDIQGAFTHAEKANQLDPDSNEARLALGQVNRYLGKHEQAQTLFDSVHDAIPTNFNAVNWLALSLADQDDPNKHQRALELMEIALKQMPKTHQSYPEAIATVGWIYHQLNDDQKAETALSNAVNSRRVGQDAYYHLARVLVKKGDNAQAKEILDMALKNASSFVYRSEAEKLLAELQ